VGRRGGKNWTSSDKASPSSNTRCQWRNRGFQDSLRKEGTKNQTPQQQTAKEISIDLPKKGMKGAEREHSDGLVLKKEDRQEREGNP